MSGRHASGWVQMRFYMSVGGFRFQCFSKCREQFSGNRAFAAEYRWTFKYDVQYFWDLHLFTIFIFLRGKGGGSASGRVILFSMFFCENRKCDCQCYFEHFLSKKAPVAEYIWSGSMCWLCVRDVIICLLGRCWRYFKCVSGMFKDCSRNVLRIF